MKILFCDNTLWGLVNFRGYVIRHFLEKGYEVVLVAPEKEDEQMQTELPSGVKYVPLQMNRTSMNPFNDLKLLFKLLRIYRKERPDFAFHYTIKPNIYGTIAARLNGICTTAMMPGTGYVFQSKTWKAALARRLYKIGLSRTDNLFLLNHENMRQVLDNRLCKKEKIILLNGGEGVDTQKFTYTDNTSAKVQFVFIGRILYDKGYEQFVDAARIVRRQHPDVRFALYGAIDPSYPHSVPTHVIMGHEAEGLVVYSGFVRDMLTVYRTPGIVVVLPSFYGEGMNRTLMEACATGKPIITTDIAGCREIVDDGQNGYVVPAKDAAALAEAMLKYIALSTKAKQSMSVRSRQIAEQRFDVANVIRIYDEIVDSNP